MRAVGMVIGNELSGNTAYVGIVERNHMVEASTASSADPSLRGAVLPRASDAGVHWLDTRGFHQCQDFIAEFSVAIHHDVFVWTGKRESLSQLLADPLSLRVRGDIKVPDLAAVVLEMRAGRSRIGMITTRGAMGLTLQARLRMPTSIVASSSILT